MPCTPIPNLSGILCVGNERVSVERNGRTYLFEWHSWCGWMPVTKDGSERLTRVPNTVWGLVSALDSPEAT